MNNASAAALAALALLTNVACTSFAPVSPTTLAPGARVRLSAASGLVLVGGTPDAPAPLLTCEVRAVTGRVTRLEGDSVFLTNIVRRDLAVGAHSRCPGVVQGVAYATSDAIVVVEQRKADQARTLSLLMATAVIIALVVYELSQWEMRAVR